MIGNPGPHSDLAATLQVNRTDVQFLPNPSRQVDVGPGLDRNIIFYGKQVKWPEKFCVM
jgi:hypothetical protein